MFSKSEIEAACGLVYSQMPATPQYAWPMLALETGCETWVKHENHTPTGAFKARGGVTFINWLTRAKPKVRAIVTATRGNHGQAQARAASSAGLAAHIFVPRGNSVEKNAAMRAFGGTLTEFGNDFEEAKLEAMRMAELNGWHPVPPFHKELVRGVATYAYELLMAAPHLHTIYVPIGCGSGICGTILARNALGLKTNVVGVVADTAQAAKLSVEAGKLVEGEPTNTFADGMAVRTPIAEAFEIYSQGAARIVSVSDVEIAKAARVLFRCTHNVAEGAGAAALAALMQENSMMQGKAVAVILTGGNIDTGQFKEVLAGGVPKV